MTFVSSRYPHCERNADCGTGYVCFEASGIYCDCDEVEGSNGNACVNATCNPAEVNVAPAAARRRLSR